MQGINDSSGNFTICLVKEHRRLIFVTVKRRRVLKVYLIFLRVKKLRKFFNELDLDLEDEVIVVRRDIYSSGKSVCRINGTIVNLSTLKKSSCSLLDIHESTR